MAAGHDPEGHAMSPISRFYDGQGADNRGRTLAEIQALDDRRMEYIHDFIQWLFPTRQPTGANPDPPGSHSRLMLPVEHELGRAGSWWL